MALVLQRSCTMEKGRYIASVIISGILLIVGIILSCCLAENGEYKAMWSLVSYIVAAVVGNLIWAEGVAFTVCKVGFPIVATVWLWFISLLGSGLGIVLLLLFFAPIGAIICTITGVTLSVMALAASIMYPINLIRYGSDLY